MGESILNIIKELDATIIGVVSVLSGYFLARYTCQQELRKMLYLRKINAYEQFISSLNLKINIFANFLNLFSRVKENTEEAVMTKYLLIYEFNNKLSEIEKNDVSLTILSFYVDLKNDFPKEDFKCKPINLIQILENLNKLSCQSLDKSHRIFILEKVDKEMLDYFLYFEAKYNYLSCLYDRVQENIRKDKIVRKLIAKV